MNILHKLKWQYYVVALLNTIIKNNTQYDLLEVETCTTLFHFIYTFRKLINTRLGGILQFFFTSNTLSKIPKMK